MHTIPTLIVGAGIAGSALACALAERGAGDGVSLVDVDIFGKYNSSELNGGGVRCTFAEPVNVRLSLASLKYYQQHADKFDFRQRGYLWMYTDALWQASREFLPALRQFELPVEELDREQLRAKFPILSDVSDIAGATFTPMDGRLSPHKLRIYYLNHAQAGRVELLDRWQVTAIDGERSPYRVTLRRVSPRSVRRALEGYEPRRKAAATATGIRADPSPEASPQRSPAPFASAELAGTELQVQVERLVNAAGPWAARVARFYGRDLPVTPLPRQVFILRHSQVNLEPLPFFIDTPQDLYFRHYERDRKPCVLVSWSDPAEPHRIEFAYHGESYYKEKVQPLLVKRIAAMADAQLVAGWAGHYELTPDKAAIIGPVPTRPGLYNLNGLSAHGVMQSRALGDALAELLAKGAWPAEMNLDELSEGRFEKAGRGVERMYV